MGRPARFVRAALALLLALAVLGLGAAPAPAEPWTGAVPAPAAFSMAAPALDLLGYANAERAAHGLKPLVWSSAIATMAQNWTASMASTALDCTTVYLKHNPNYQGQTPGNWTLVGENVGCAQPARAKVIHDAWMASPGHRANLLRPEFTHIGIGWAVTKNGIAFATQDFAAYPVSKSAAPPVSKSAAPPVSKSAAPPVTKAAAPPVTKAAAPPATKSAAPPATTKQTAPAATKKITVSKPAAPAPPPTAPHKPKVTPTPTPKPSAASRIEPVTNPAAGLNAARSSKPTPTGGVASQSVPTWNDSPASGAATDAELLIADGAANGDASPNRVIPAGVSTLTLIVGGAWIVMTRRRRFGV